MDRPDPPVPQHCQPCEGGIPPLLEVEIQEALKSLPGWTPEKGAIAKTYSFRDFYRTMAFVNAVAFIAHREDHHPDLEVGYKTCRVIYSTHSIGGVSRNDLICASLVEALIPLEAP